MNPKELSAERGMSLVEIVVGVVILSVTLLGLAGAMSVGLRKAAQTRSDTQYWGLVQQEMDSLVARGWGHVTSGSVTVKGRAMTWTVSAAGANLQQITFVAPRPGYQQRSKIVQDTVVMYLAKGTL